MVSTEISNLELTNRIGTSPTNWKFYGSVLVTTTKSKFWGRDVVLSERRNIYKKYGDGWCYIEDGVYLPVNAIEGLVRSWEAKNQTSIEDAEL